MNFWNIMQDIQFWNPTFNTQFLRSVNSKTIMVAGRQLHILMMESICIQNGGKVASLKNTYNLKLLLTFSMSLTKFFSFPWQFYKSSIPFSTKRQFQISELPRL